MDNRNLLCAAALLVAASAGTAGGDDAAGNPEAPDPRAGDYFVGASVFLFERSVLAAFAPPEIGAEAGGGNDAEAMLDAGAIVLAQERAGDERGSIAMEAMVAWLDAWLGQKPAATGPPGFDAARRHSLACLAYGADPQNLGTLAQHAGLAANARSDCVARYQAAVKQWTAWLLPFRKRAAPMPMHGAPDGAPTEDAPMLRLVFAPSFDDADAAIAETMRKNGLFQALTDDLDARLRMPRPMTALLTQCGEARAFYNPDRGEAVLCYELLGEWLKAAP